MLCLDLDMMLAVGFFLGLADDICVLFSTTELHESIHPCGMVALSAHGIHYSEQGAQFRHIVLAYFGLVTGHWFNGAMKCADRNRQCSISRPQPVLSKHCRLLVMASGNTINHLILRLMIEKSGNEV